MSYANGGTMNEAYGHRINVPPVIWNAPWVHRVRCWLRLHNGQYALYTRSVCFTIRYYRVCLDCGKERWPP